MPTIRSEAIIRRNGASAACEPCRIRKLACDHGEPVCARCVKRGKSDLCNYHPAPMVGMKRRRSKIQSTGIVNGFTSPAAASSGTPTRSSTSPVRVQFPAQASEATIPTQDEHPAIPAEESQPGYLGATSFITSLAESREELERENSHSQDGALAMVSLRDVPTSIAAAEIEAGAAVLASFYPCKVAGNLIDTAYTQGHCVPYAPEPILRECWHSIRSILAPIEGCKDRHKKLQEISRLIFHNTIKILPDPGQVSMRTYAAVFTGPNLRWESIGIVLTTIGATLMRTMKTFSSVVMCGAKSTKETVKWLADASNRCLGFCDALNLVNDMTLWMIMDNLVLISQFFGDTSYLHWKRLGDLSTCIFAMGLHHNPRRDSRIPRWLVEIRQQARHGAFLADLNLSMFMGRPPRLSTRYCSFDTLPLELSNEELALEPADLEIAIQKLSPEGMRSVRDVALRSVSVRELYPIIRLREEILQLCLGTPSDSESRQRAEHMVQLSQQLWQSKSKEFRYDPCIWTAQRSVKDCSFILYTYLEHLYNDFLLQRVLVQRFTADPEELLVIAGNLLSNTLVLFGKEGDADLDWILSLYSLPSAGVLALELLKQQTQSDYRPSPRAPSRSKIVQHLSVLIGALKLISREGVGNYSLGKQACATIERVLDRVLNLDCVPARIVQQVQQNSQPQREWQQQQQQQQQPTPQEEQSSSQTYMALPQHDLSSAGSLRLPDGPGLPWIGQTDFDEAFWLGLEEHPLMDDRALGSVFVNGFGAQ